ncbi:MAG: efflux RND transporter periplasmic adaptor subunit [Ignavibacteriae bacterium]|nr:efflux RND transporter periplasmic adaptor subunit [Ignavibacteriota bacterium]
MSTKTKRTVLLLGAGVVLIALTLPKIITSGNPGTRSNNPALSRDQQMDVRTVVVRAEKLGGKVTAVGTVLSNEEVDVRSQVSGQIERISFKEGARVKKGNVLVKINDDELQAQLLRAESRLAIAEQQAARQRQLFEKKFVSEEEYNSAMNELNVVRADAQLIKAQVEKTEIRAPFDGTIGLRFVSEGSYVSPAIVITTLQDNSRMKIDFTIPEKYAAEVKVGDGITFRVQTRPEQFEAKIYSMDARINQTTRTLRLRALTSNPKGLLLPGSFATIEVILNERSALTIPTYALIPELKGHRVFVYRHGIAESQSVEIGTRAEERVEITKGLSDGDTLIISAILQLRPGAAVRPQMDRQAGAQ